MNDASPVAALFDELAPDYDQGGVPLFRPVADRVLALADPRPGERALDVGCGRGAVTLPLADAVGPGGHVVGVDLSRRMVDLLGEDAAQRGLSLELLVGQVADHPHLTGTCDLVTASLVLFFSPTPVETLRSWLACLVPGGRAVLTTFPASGGGMTELGRVLAPYVEGPVGPPGPNPFAEDETLDPLLAKGGLRAARHSRATEELRFPDAEAWRAWSMTTGLRQVWARVPADRVPEARAAVSAHLETTRVDGGPIRTLIEVRYTTGLGPR